MAATGVKVTAGVDTHKDVHVAVALDGIGGRLGTDAFPNSRAGYARLLAWLESFGEVVAAGVEGTGSWGAGLARFLTANGVRVVEVNRPNRQVRRRRGKSDPVDAEAAARVVLSGEATTVPKSADGQVEAIRVLRIARGSALKARTQAANQIHSLIDTAPDTIREELRGLSLAALVRRAARFRPGTPDAPLPATKTALNVLARRWQALDAEITSLDRAIHALVAAVAPTLIAEKGVGPDTAATLLVAAGDNPDRLRSERSFAALCGVSPLDASSGRQQRHRLNRGGDRQANRALHTVIIGRLSWHQPTQAYMARRLAEGKTKKEVIRCLKRHLARQLYRHLRQSLEPRLTTSAGADQTQQAA